MICFPLTADQPLIAYRISDELGLGVRLDFSTMTTDDIGKSICKVLNDGSFYERADRYSKLSRQYIGYSNGAQLIADFFKKKKE